MLGAVPIRLYCHPRAQGLACAYPWLIHRGTNQGANLRFLLVADPNVHFPKPRALKRVFPERFHNVTHVHGRGKVGIAVGNARKHVFEPKHGAVFQSDGTMDADGSNALVAHAAHHRAGQSNVGQWRAGPFVVNNGEVEVLACIHLAGPVNAHVEGHRSGHGAHLPGNRGEPIIEKGAHNLAAAANLCAS
jgi:hypothetical protein